MHVGSQIVNPQRLCPRLLLSGLGVEEQHVGLHAPGVENAGGQSQKRVNITLLHEIATNRFSSSPLKQHVVRYDDRAASIHFEKRLDVLDEVQLLVLRRRPKVLAFVSVVILLQIARFVDNRDTALLPERWIGHDHAEPFTRITSKTIHPRFDRTRIGVDAVQVEIHDAEAGGIRDQLPAFDKLGPQVLLLIFVECLALMLGNVIVSSQEKATCARGGIAYGVIYSRLNAIDDRFDEFTRREVLTCTFWAFGGALGEQAFVDIPFDIRIHRRPLFNVDQIDDQSPERCWILDFWSCLFEDFAEHSRLLAKFFQDVTVVSFEFVPFALEQAFPIVFGGNNRRLVVRWLRLFVSHFEEQQERNLFGIGHVRKAIVAQNVGEVPGFVDDLLGVVVAHDGVFCAFSTVVFITLAGMSPGFASAPIDLGRRTGSSSLRSMVPRTGRAS